jgi:hypothetical protein
MKQLNHTLEPPLKDWFALLRPIPPRDPVAAARGKENFMVQVRSLPAPVSKSDGVRHIRWIDSIRQLIRNKEYSPMYVAFTSIVLAISLLFGGAGATVYAAQDSLPNQALYGVKTFSEDLTRSLSLRNQLRLQLELDYASRRVDEMASLAMAGLQPPEAVLLRLEMHLDQAIKLAANTGEGDMLRLLRHVQRRLQQHIRILDEAPQSGPLMIRARDAIQTRLQWVALGLSEPNTFREQVQVRNQFQQLPEIGESYGPGPGPNPDREPGEGEFGPRPGPASDQEPIEGGYSPGPGPNPDQEPGESGYSPGPGPNPDQEPGENNMGPGPGPAPGYETGENGHSPGPGSNPDQEPGANNPGPGPGPASDQESGEGLNPDCPNPENGSNDGENGPNSTQGSGDGSQKGNGGKP